MARFVKETPNGDGWQCGAYRFFPASDGSLSMEVGGNSYGIGFSNGAIVNGAIVNGVAYFTTTTAPTLRIDGSALVDGDRWYDPSTRKEWMRKGIYWLSPRIIIGAGTGGTLSASSSFYSDNVFNFSSVYIESSAIAIRFNDRNQDATDHWDITWGLAYITAASINHTVQSLASDTQDGGLLKSVAYKFESQVDTVIALPIYSVSLYRGFLSATKTGSNTNRIGLSATLTYREVYV